MRPACTTALLFLLTLTGCPQPAPPAWDDDDASGDDDDSAGDDDDSSSDPWEPLRAAVEAAAVEDLTLLIGTAEGTVFVHEKGASTAGQVYSIASASKWLTSVTALAMVEAGTLALDDRPQDHLSWWTADPADSRSAVTLEQLLSFTSGLTGDPGLAPGQEGIACVEDGETTLDACAQEIYEHYFAYPPGSTFYYGPGHLQVAAAMGAAHTSQRWNQLFRAHVGAPLGLALSTGFALPSLDNPRAAGGGTASGADYGAVLTALAAGTLLTPATLEQMGTDHTPAGVNMASGVGAAGLGQAWHYGLGCWRECVSDSYTAACDAPGVECIVPFDNSSRTTSPPSEGSPTCQSMASGPSDAAATPSMAEASRSNACWRSMPATSSGLGRLTEWTVMDPCRNSWAPDR